MKDGAVVGRFVYSPHKPLSCGARVWLELADGVTAVLPSYDGCRARYRYVYGVLTLQDDGRYCLDDDTGLCVINLDLSDLEILS